MITAVLITYNNADYIREAVLSALNQQPGFARVIVIDDCSGDGTSAILDELALGEPRLMVIRHAQNKGAGAARNTGLDHVETPFLCFLDGDDLFFEDAGAKLHAAAAQEDTDLWIFEGRIFYTGSDRTQRTGRVVDGVFDTMKEKETPLASTSYPWNKLYRTALVRENAIRFPDGRYEDLPWCFACILGAGRVRAQRVPIVHYRRHDEAVTDRKSSVHWDVFDQWERAMEVVRARGGPQRLAEELRFIQMVRILDADRLPEAELGDFADRILELCGPMGHLRATLETRRGIKSLKSFRRFLVARDEARTG